MSGTAPLCQTQIPVSFGDCDPAGIAFYPNFFRWTDALFHRFLRERVGGHKPLCAELGIRGLGVMAAEMRFVSPASEGDLLTLALERVEWADRSFALHYAGTIGQRPVIEGRETRGLFAMQDGRMRAAATGPLRSRLG